MGPLHLYLSLSGRSSLKSSRVSDWPLVHQHEFHISCSLCINFSCITDRIVHFWPVCDFYNIQNSELVLHSKAFFHVYLIFCLYDARNHNFCRSKSFQWGNSEWPPNLGNFGTKLSKCSKSYLKFLLMRVIEAELNKIEGKSLHFLTYFESMPIHFLIFFSFFVVNWVKTIRNSIVITQSLFICNYRKSFPGTNFHNKQFIFCLFSRSNIFNLSHREHHSSLPMRIQIKSLLTDSLNSIWPHQFIRFQVDFGYNETLVLLIKLSTEIGVNNIVYSLQFNRSISKVELEFVLNGIPLCVFRVYLLIFF